VVCGAPNGVLTLFCPVVESIAVGFKVSFGAWLPHIHLGAGIEGLVRLSPGTPTAAFDEMERTARDLLTWWVEGESSSELEERAG
jgi:hypothetical protein